MICKESERGEGRWQRSDRVIPIHDIKEGATLNIMAVSMAQARTCLRASKQGLESRRSKYKQEYGIGQAFAEPCGRHALCLEVKSACTSPHAAILDFPRSEVQINCTRSHPPFRQSYGLAPRVSLYLPKKA